MTKIEDVEAPTPSVEQAETRNENAEVDEGAMDAAAPPESEAPGSPDNAVADSQSGDGDATGDRDGDGAELPADPSRLISIIESLLFAADRPLSVADFKRLLDDPNGPRIAEILEQLRVARAETGIQLVSVAGAWQLRTHPGNGHWVAKLVAGRPQRLSRAMMETLAIVAYRQPITRPEVDEIRGVDCGPVLRTLLERGLVRALGKREEVGRPILYGTTPDFLKTFSMRDLTELPTLREFHELGAEERAKVDSKLGPAASTTAEAAGQAGGESTPAAIFAVSELPTYDPSEEDSLIEELETATRVAAMVTRVNADPAPEDGDSEPSAEEPVGGSSPANSHRHSGEN